MCLAILAPLDSIRLDLVSEQVWFRVAEGEMGAVGCCDIFFTVNEPIDRLILLSPHLLFQNGILGVTSERVMASGDKFDNVYQKCGGAVCVHQTGTFCVPLEAIGGTTGPPDEYRGKIIVPEISIPPEAAGDVRALVVMNELGTVFQLKFSDLRPKTTYVVRLKLQPHRLTVPTRPVNIPNPETGEEGAQWIQTAKIYSPETLFGNTLKILDKLSEFEEVAYGASLWKSLLTLQPLVCGAPERTRITFVFPAGTTLEHSNEIGNVMSLGPRSVIEDNNQRLSHQWEGGTGIYWADDQIAVAQRIFEHVLEWGAKEPKTKEEITSALANPENLQHANASLVVDALTTLGALQRINDQQYKAAIKPEQLPEILGRIAKDAKLSDEFTTTGFQITLSMRFPYRSAAYLERQQKEKERRRHLDDLAEKADKIGRKALVWAIAGAILALVGIIIALPPLVDMMSHRETKVSQPIQEVPDVTNKRADTGHQAGPPAASTTAGAK